MGGLATRGHCCPALCGWCAPHPAPSLEEGPREAARPPSAPSASCWLVAARPTSPLSARRGPGRPEGRAASSSLSKSAGRGAGGRPLPGAAWLRAAGTGLPRMTGSEDTAAEGSEDTRVPRREGRTHTHAWAPTRPSEGTPARGTLQCGPSLLLAHRSVHRPWDCGTWQQEEA